ncbi:glycosyltransferase family 4 protein [Thalassospira sp.]|uniref:glycosyltransferase family 4 protein n=1 Tax=Thalassospira sp. TaxID=1912094 RepID=UPI003AA9637F
MHQTFPSPHWRETLLGVAAVLFGLSAPLFFFGREAMGVGLGLLLIAAIVAVVSADHARAWRKMRHDIWSPLGELFVLGAAVLGGAAAFTALSNAPLWIWLGHFLLVVGVWYLACLIAPKAKVAWDAWVYVAWGLFAYGLVALGIKSGWLSPDVIHGSNFVNYPVPLDGFLVCSAVLLFDLIDRKNARRYFSGLVGLCSLFIVVVSWTSETIDHTVVALSWPVVILSLLAMVVLRHAKQQTGQLRSRRRKTLFVCAEDWSFVSHRIGLGRAALVRGDDVVVACNTGAKAEALRKEGFRVVKLPIARGGLSPIKSLKTIKALMCLIRRENPDIVVNVAIQCVVLSSIAGLLVGAQRSVNMITGLGFLFVSEGPKVKLVRQIVLLVLRFFAFCPSIRVIVQNVDDQSLITRLGFNEKRIALIRGSGVDISTFSPADKVSRENRIAIFVARMLWSKGLGELVEAARILKSRGYSYRFVLVGDVDRANPDSASERDLRGWQEEGLVEWLGKRSDVAALLRNADLAVLPSWREGLPKSLLEAAASGLALVATDVPGCREIVHDGENGLLVPLRDPNALASAIEELMEDDLRRQSFGRAARQLVERELCDQVVIARTLDFITSDRQENASIENPD